MKKLLFLLVIVTSIFAKEYVEIIQEIKDSPLLSSAKKLEKSAYSLTYVQKANNMPKLDLSLDAVWLKEKPSIIFKPDQTSEILLPTGSKRNFIGSIKLTYPIFTGFAQSLQIKKSELEYEIAKLKSINLKRELYLKATELASEYYSAQKRIEASKEAKKALDDAYKKAKELYENGLIAPSELYNIEYKLYSVESDIESLKAIKRGTLNRLEYLTGRRLNSVKLPKDSFLLSFDKDSLIDKALNSREDILFLKRVTEVSESEISLAKSRFYPTVAAVAEAKRRGDTLSLNGDGYTNPDQSYFGLFVKWNIFNGFSDKRAVEAAKYRSLSDKIELNNYKKLVETDLKELFLIIDSTFNRLKSAQKQLKAANAYFELVKGRFENQLSSADELSRAIAELSTVKAKISILESDIFTQKATIYLQVSIDSFYSNLLNHYNFKK